VVIKLTLLCLIFFSVLYTLVMLGIAQFSPNHGKGETVQVNGKTVGYTKLGQSFTDEKYFWGRPSAINYNAAGSCGSNKGTANAAYIEEVRTRIDTFLVHHPYLSKKDIPTEMVTASGSGLDPDISPESAMIQAQRIARIRNISEEKVLSLIQSFSKKPVLGTPTVNVLELNIALDRIKG